VRRLIPCELSFVCVGGACWTQYYSRSVQFVSRLWHYPVVFMCFVACPIEWGRHLSPVTLFLNFVLCGVRYNLQKHSRITLAGEGLARLEEWGMLAVKSGVHGMKEVMNLTQELQKA
jgi:hypothetical protein